MTRFRSLFVGAAIVAPALLGAQQREPFPGLESYIANAVKTWKIPGVSVAIVRNDSVLYTKGFGVLSATSTTPVNENTLFEIGSSSKAFTATLVAMLVSDGKMRFDAHVTDYLPNLRLNDPVANAELTIRDALTHRSGLARGELVWLGSGLSREEVLHRLRFLKPASPFRSQYSYQNMMFLAAGEAAGKAGGSTWDDLIKQRIFGPLDMSASLTTSRGLTNTNATLPHGTDRDSAIIKPYMNGTNIGPAGSILSSARDMAQWLRFQLNDGMYNGKRVVSSAALRETHTPQILMGGGGGRGRGGDSIPATHFSTYGMGWMIEDYHQQLVWQHGGNTEGMTAAVGMMPEKKFGVVVLSNMQSAALPDIIMRYIFDRQIGYPVKDPSGDAYTRMIAQRRRADSAQVTQAGARAKGEPPVPLSEFVGAYADSVYGEAVVTLESGRLQLKRGDWRGPLEYWNASNFRWTTGPSSVTGPMFIKFEVSPESKVTGLYFGLPGDTYLLGRKTASGGGRGRAGGPGETR